MANVKVGLIGGSGLGAALGGEEGQRVRPQTPFGAPSSAITTTTWEGVDVAILQRHGEGHVLSPSKVPYRANIFALKSLGVTHIVASAASGSLREEIAPGDLVITDQVIDKTFKRPGTFYENAVVHVELSEPFCNVMREWLLAASTDLEDVRVHDGGVLVCMEGPAFSTKAESAMHRTWGGDLIGMTVMPEARLAREAEIAYAQVALPTDYDCWRPHAPSTDRQALLAEIIDNLQRATDNSMKLIRRALRDISALESRPSLAHDALRLAIWTDRSRIDVDEVERLRVLWGRHFE